MVEAIGQTFQDEARRPGPLTPSDYRVAGRTARERMRSAEYDLSRARDEHGQIAMRVLLGTADEVQLAEVEREIAEAERDIARWRAAASTLDEHTGTIRDSNGHVLGR